jgi:hypothetical protein
LNERPAHGLLSTVETATATLEKEMETYRRELPRLSQQEGKFVLIHGENVVDVFTSYEDAIKAGYVAFSVDPFLVKEIEITERVHFICRFELEDDSP